MLCVVLVFLLLASSFAGKFGKYDITFYKTVDDSIAIMNMERLGFDYTGYGYLGEDMTTGIYMRFGMQAPYSTLFSLFTPINSQASDSSSDVDSSTSSDSSTLIEGSSISMDDATTSSKNEREFAFSFTIGPAFRHFISESVMWYMGMGVSGMITQNVSSKSDDTLTTSFSLKLGSDLDSGFRLDLAERSSLRLGVHITTGLLTYSNTTITDGDGSSTTNSIVADVFRKVGEQSSTRVAGYVGLAHVFKSNDIVKYRYSNTTSRIGGGVLVEL